jgi:hypothetical protein
MYWWQEPLNPKTLIVSLEYIYIFIYLKTLIHYHLVNAMSFNTSFNASS